MSPAEEGLRGALQRNTALAGSLFRGLRPGGPPVLDARRIALVVAHPDDETIGLGAQLPRLAGVRIVHVTDGAPADMRDAIAHGCATREDYAALRRAELETAMGMAGIPPARLVGLGIADQEASQVMSGLAGRLADLFDTGDVGVVVTHPYEGGHPDNDATCFGVHAACALLRREGRPAPVLLEFTSYHIGRSGELVTGHFLQKDGTELVIPLDSEDRELKTRLMDCHASQASMLADFGLAEEQLRPAPSYDFLSAPHPGRLWYENFNWGTDGATWRHWAAEAIAMLELEAPPWR